MARVQITFASLWNILVILGLGRLLCAWVDSLGRWLLSVLKYLFPLRRLILCLLSVIRGNEALAGVNYLFEINPEFVCGCVRWYTWSVRSEVTMAKGPGERGSVEMTWWVFVAVGRRPR